MLNKLGQLMVMLTVLMTTSENFAQRLAPALTEASRNIELTLYSTSLKENRVIWVRQPITNNGSNEEQVINMYVLDADWLFPIIASYVDYLVFYYQIPPIRVIGLKNSNRNRDFITEVDEQFPLTGKGQKFQFFIDQELRPHVKKLYGTSRGNILLGHSFGGVAALTHLFQSTSRFDAYFTIGTSTWIADDSLFTTAENGIKNLNIDSSLFLYMAVAEHDGGETVPSNKNFANLLQNKAHEGLEWYFDVIEQSNHFTAVIPAFEKALNHLFPGWEFSKKIQSIPVSEQTQWLDSLFEQEEINLGFRFWPHTDQLSLLAIQWAQQGRKKHSTVLMEKLLSIHSLHPETYALGAYVAMINKNNHEALKRIDRALMLGQKQQYNSNRLLMYQNVKERIEGTISSGKTQ